MRDFWLTRRRRARDSSPVPRICGWGRHGEQGGLDWNIEKQRKSSFQISRWSVSEYVKLPNAEVVVGKFSSSWFSPPTVGRSRLNERTSSVGGGAAAARCSAAWPSSFLLEPFLFDLGALGGRACHAGRTGGACRGTEGESRVKRAFVSWKERMATTLESPFLLSHLYSTMRGPFSIPS